METKWLEDFLCLAETRNFARAASDRHITQSAFSRRIMALEEWLGVNLVDRSLHPATLTSAGWLFRRLAADLLCDAYAARTLVCGHQPLADSTKVVQFAVAHTLVFTFFPNWLKHLHDGLGSLTTRVLAVNVPEGVQPRSTRCGPRYATSKVRCPQIARRGHPQTQAQTRGVAVRQGSALQHAHLQIAGRSGRERAERHSGNR